MSGRTLVLPCSPSLLASLGRPQDRPRTLVPVVERVERIGEAVEAVNRAGHRLHAVWVRTGAPLSALRLDPRWSRTPVALEAPALGGFAEALPRIREWRGMDLTLFLPSAPGENLTSLRLLSSLGVECALLLSPPGVDWEAVSDLMTWALLGRVERAPLHPFTSMAERYRPDQVNDLGRYRLDDPAAFLHLDAEGRVALTREELEQGRFAAPSLAEAERGPLEELPAWHERQARRDTEFLAPPGGCASCPGFRLCGASFRRWRGEERGCAAFFSEWMECLEQKQSSTPPRRSPWRP